MYIYINGFQSICLSVCPVPEKLIAIDESTQFNSNDQWDKVVFPSLPLDYRNRQFSPLQS